LKSLDFVVCLEDLSGEFSRNTEGSAYRHADQESKRTPYEGRQAEALKHELAGW